jgi:hypothetical protein
MRCALSAGTPWLDVYCLGCRTSRAIDIRKIDRHPLASVGKSRAGGAVLMCLGSASMAVITGLVALASSFESKRGIERQSGGLALCRSGRNGRA